MRFISVITTLAFAVLAASVPVDEEEAAVMALPLGFEFEIADQDLPDNGGRDLRLKECITACKCPRCMVCAYCEHNWTKTCCRRISPACNSHSNCKLGVQPALGDVFPTQ